MHTDESKRFDKRNIQSNLRRRVVSKKDYETYLTKLPDVSDKMFSFEEKSSEIGEELEEKRTLDVASKKKGKIKEKG
jgi:hypothetical protein